MTAGLHRTGHAVLMSCCARHAGAMYLVYKAVTFILRSLWRSAAVSSALAALRTQLLQP